LGLLKLKGLTWEKRKT